ncbi:MAG: hypothetical protein EA421_12110 [Gemmatimonadales bacterium]|nr:MAG: hypothetical protein EA421_12110 [Gemmatimonadales bacterium]
MAFLLSSLIWAGLWVLLTPGELLAWGPATHVAIGEAVLSSLHLLPPAVRGVLERNRIPFLYGSVAADISFAKKYAETGRHSHHWHIGEEIYESADSEELQAVGLGYLAHLAADTIAHNFFVPRRLLLTSTTAAVGHTYWEHRMDMHLGDRFLIKARRVVLHHDHAEADELFDRVLSRTLFSFQTNRRIFRGMVAFQDDVRWRNVFAEMLRRSRFDLPEDLRDRYVRLAFDYVMEYLSERHRSRAAALDPVGEINLKLSKRVRRRGVAQGPWRGMKPGEEMDILEAWADEFFPLPGEPLLYVPRARSLRVPGLILPGTGGVEPESGSPPSDRPSPLNAS